jgi:hypothetical protein
MTLAIDTSTALRSAEQVRVLAEAIFRAPQSEQESRCVEWKGSWDLRGSAKDRFSTAKHILGFANRDVEIASRTFEGCAYLVAGVEPGVAAGVAHEDSATLTGWLSTYLGTDGPVWSPHWVTVVGVTVLVLLIEAPLPGDPIHSLRKAYDGCAPGRVFTRREGQTAEANPDELKMLQARLTAIQPDTNLSAQLDLIGRMSDQLDEISRVAWAEALDPDSVPVLPPNNIRLSPIARMCSSLEVSIAMYAAQGGEPPTELVEFARQSKSAGANRTQIAGEAGMLISRLQALVAGVEVLYQR